MQSHLQTATRTLIISEVSLGSEITWGHVGIMVELPAFQSCCSPGLTTALTQPLSLRTHIHTQKQKQLRIQGRRCNTDDRDAHQQLSFLHVLCTDSSIQWTPFSSTLSKLNTCKYQGGLLYAAIYNLQQWCSIFLKDWFTQNTKKIFGRYPLDAINSDCWHLNFRV